MELLTHEAKQIHPAVPTEPTSFVSMTRTRELEAVFNTAAVWPIFTDARVLCVEGCGESCREDEKQMWIKTMEPDEIKRN